VWDIPHWLRWDEFGDAGITRFDKFGRGFNRLSTPTIDLLNEFGEFASDVGGVAIEDGGVTSTDLTGVVKDDDLSVEGSGLLGGVVLRVRGNISTTNILDRDVPAAQVRSFLMLSLPVLRT
jgi:hypothetical protein